MSLFDRLARVAKANVEDFFRQFDAGEATFDDKVDEMECAMRRKGRGASYSISVRNLEEERDQVILDMDKCDEDAMRALNAENEALARDKMAEKVLLEERLSKLEPAIEEGRQTYRDLKVDLKDLQLKLDQARAKQVELEARRQAAEARKTADEVLDTVHEYHDDLDIHEESVLDEEVVSEAQSTESEEKDVQPMNSEGESHDNKIEAKLNELRKRMGPE